MVDLICYDEFTRTTETTNEVRIEAKVVIVDAMSGAEYGDFEDKPAFGNRPGLRLLNRLEDMKMDTDRLNAQMAAQSSKMATFESKMATQSSEMATQSSKMATFELMLASQYREGKSTEVDTEKKLQAVMGASDGYMRIRNRFVETFQRDVLQRPVDQQAMAVIYAGNEAAHAGEAVMDVLLYKRGLRDDKYMINEIYGVDADVITKRSKEIRDNILDKIF